MASFSSTVGTSLSTTSSSSLVDPTAQMNTYRSYVTILSDPVHKDENKLKAAQAISEELESIIALPNYSAFLDHAIKIFLKILLDGTPLFISEQHIQMLRKCILDIIQRLPSNDHLKPHIRAILSVCFRLLDTDNEENVMVALHIVTEMHKNFRPQFNPDIQKFLMFVKNMYKNLPKHMDSIFEPHPVLKVEDISEINVEALIEETFTVTSIHTDRKTNEGVQIVYNLIPRATKSLKVLTELPIIFVLMLQLYKEQVYPDVIDFIPLIMDTIVLEPNVNRESESFNKELFVDLIGAQIKILSFLAYIVKSFHEKVNANSNKLVKGMLNLLKLCPDEVASLRRELLIATKHILALDIRTKFVPHMNMLFDEDLLFGKGWTAHETLRPLAYSTLADLVHHVRTDLDVVALSKAVHLFSKNIHDDTLPPSIQTMSCKLLLNLVDCLKEKPDEIKNPILFRMLEICVLKVKAMSQVFVPTLRAKQQNSNTEADSKPDEKSVTDSENCVKAFSITTPPNVTLNDGRALLKNLISAVKTITWGYAPHPVNKDQHVGHVKPLTCREVRLYLRFVKWALKAMDIFSINNMGQPVVVKGQSQQTIRTKEEREVLEHFAGVFIILHPMTFKEIFVTCIDDVVEAIHSNPSLQVVVNSLLARPESSPLFATILVEYLLKHMPEMGTLTDRASMNLKLFKLVFGSVSILASENETMLKPHLHKIVNKSMELAMTARDPYNYFLLLRALFRSIGGGSHDILYQEFLPLLPTLLQGLNSLQSGLHKQHMKDLFVELCLTVPVRLSSLLPYLPMLMDPLVSALNGSQTLVSQGLRTLELCVDNLQPDFLYEHIQPVRAELMQALWKTLRNPNEHNSQVTFRVLGKFGGGNRKMMTEPQRFTYRQQQSYSCLMNIHFDTAADSVKLPVERIIESAFAALKSSNTETWYRQQSWEIIRCYLVGSMEMDCDRAIIYRLFTDPAFKECDISRLVGPYYRCSDEQARHVHQTAVTAMFVAAAIKDLRNEVLQTMVAIIRHYTMIAIAQQAGPFCLDGKWHMASGMDPLVMIDALVFIMGHEEKELCKPGHLALVLIMNAAIDILGSKERACQLPLMEYLAEKMCGLCFDRAWYAKLGGCIAIKLLFENMSLRWVLEHQYAFLRALIYVMLDLTDEVSTGAVEKAINDLEKMLHVCVTPLEGTANTDEMRAIQQKSVFDVTHELVRQVTSPNTTVREQAMRSLQLIAKLTNKGVTEVMEPHKEVLIDMIPPKKHFILRHQPANTQIGLMEGNTFCTTLKPRLFTLDLDITEHKNFFSDLHQLVEKDDASLSKFACYKNVTNLVPLRKAALKALTACHYIVKDPEKLFSSLCKVLNTNNNVELQETAFECLQTFLKECNLSRDSVVATVRPLLTSYYNSRGGNAPVIQRLSYWIRLFPQTFHEKLCDTLVSNAKGLVDHIKCSLQEGASKTKSSDIEIFTGILTLMHQMQQTTPCHIEILCGRVLCTEQLLLQESTSPLRAPLMKLCLRFPKETVQVFLHEKHISNEVWGRLFYCWLRDENGTPFLEEVSRCSDKLLAILVNNSSSSNVPFTQPVQKSRDNSIYAVIRICSSISKKDSSFLNSNPQLIAAIKNIWTSEDFHSKYITGEGLDVSHWSQPRMMVKILLAYFKQNTDEIQLLFSVLRCFIGRFILEFHFVKEFFEETIAKTYPIEWKRKAFFEFARMFQDQTVPQFLKAKILQHCILPCVTYCLENGQGCELIGYPPDPDHDSDDNLVTVFINKIIDPEDPFRYMDIIRILLLQMSCLLVDKASDHIHDAGNKKQGVKLRRLMTYAWPCLLLKNCVDPATKYHGHLLLAHIIAKFAIHKRIVLQVFHSLLKAYAPEAKGVVRQALEILTPAMPIRMEDGNTMLIHWTRKILVEEGHTVGQLVHILQLIVRHSQVYYPVRSHLIQHITAAMQRLGFIPSVNSDQRKLTVDLGEMCIRWEEQHINEENTSAKSNNTSKRTNSTESIDIKRARLSIGSRSSMDSSRPVEKQHVDTIVYVLLKLACQTNDNASVANPSSSAETISKRCFTLLKKAFELWPNADPKLHWMDKLFATLDSPATNLNSVSVGIELITFLIGSMKKDLLLASMKTLSKGLLCCATYYNPKIVKLSYNMITKLMSTFPCDPTNMSSRCEELEDLYGKIAKSIFDGLTKYEHQEAIPPTLYANVMTLKAACNSNPCYIDRLMTSFMKIIQKFTREHLNPTNQSDNTGGLTDLLITSLEIVKSRVGVMGNDLKKGFIGNVLVNLIEKSLDVKVVKCIVKIVDEWVRNKSTVAVNQGPNFREKSIMLVKLQSTIEKRFPDEPELLTLYLELVLFAFTDDSLKNTELAAKLEPAFLTGLRCSQPTLRAKFFKVFNESIPTELMQRLLYIVCSQNWENMGSHYWIKQCIEIILTTGQADVSLLESNPKIMIPKITSVMNLYDPSETTKFLIRSKSREDLDEFLLECTEKEDEIDMDAAADGQTLGSTSQENPLLKLKNLISAQNKFFNNIANLNFLSAVSQLCHMDTNLAEWVWLQLFPSLWSSLTNTQQQRLSCEMLPFISSGAHVLQKDCHPSALNTFVEALSHCDPPIVLQPNVMKYIGKGHNLWHRMTLNLERMAYDLDAMNPSQRGSRRENLDLVDPEALNSAPQNVIDALSEMYSLLGEEDMWAGLWQNTAHYPETKMAVTYEQHGFLEQAQATYELAMSKAKADMNNKLPTRTNSELKMWEDHWLKCAKELSQWELVLEYGSNDFAPNSMLVLESSWQLPNWTLMKDALANIDSGFTREMAWKINLYKGYVAVCHPDANHTQSNIDKLVEICTNLCIKEWKRLPHIVSHVHLTYLQAAQQVMELQEAFQIRTGIAASSSSTGGGSASRSNSLQDMKAIVKTWRNRLPVLSDSLRHWSDIFTWRQHHYQFIVNHYAEQQEHHAQSMLGVHASAQAIIHFGKIARKHNLTTVCLDSLSKIHSIQSVPIVDCFQKIRQQVKCYHQMAIANSMSRNELQEGLEVIESTNLKYFTKEMTAEFYALKGMFLSQLSRTEEANKSLSSAVQLHDTLVKGWALWGDYMEGLFTRDPAQKDLGVSAITCYLHACRHQNETKSRKYIAKVFFLLSYDDEMSSLSDAVEKYSIGVPAIQWLLWIPQLLTCLVRPEGKVIITLLNQVGKIYPQAVYLPIRSLYLTLRIEQRGRYRRDSTTTTASQQSASSEQGPIRATEAMRRCSRILQVQRDYHPTILVSLEAIAEQILWFRENWYEEVLRQLRQALTKCYAIAFENSASVAEAMVTNHTQSFLKKLVATFGIGIGLENVTSSVGSSGSESLVKRAQATLQDAVFVKLKKQFAADLDFSQPGALKLHNLIIKLKKWIKKLELKVQAMPKSMVIEEKCGFLSKFCLQTAEVELPGEFLLPKQSNYYIRIARFLPRIDVVQKHGTVPKRLYIRGHNGRIYPYLIVSDSSPSDGCREERVLQLLRMLNHFFSKQKETSKRLVNMSVMKVVAISPQMRLVEDNVSSLSLLDIYKQQCANRQLEPDEPINKYYEKLAAIQARGSQASHQVLREILKEVQLTMVPPTMLKEWALHIFPNPTNYWTFRKMMTLQISVISLMEYALHLTRLFPDMMYIHQDSGLVNVSYFKFNIDDAKGELDGNWPVPFRITPNLCEIATSLGVAGPLTATMIAAARCLATPSLKASALLRAILRDEVISWHKRWEVIDTNIAGASRIEGDALVTRVNKAVSTIMARIHTLGTLDGADNKVIQMVRAVDCLDNLCRMDPAWHPWL